MELLKTAVTEIPTGIALLDRDLVFRWVNPQFARNFQRSPEDFVGHPYADAALGVEDRTGALQRVLESGEPLVERSNPVVLMNGSGPRQTFWDFSFVPIGPQGAPTGLLAMAIEVPPRKPCKRFRDAGKSAAPQESQRRSAALTATEIRRQSLNLRNMVEAMPEAIVVSDCKGRIRQINSQTEALFGYTRRELFGKPVGFLVPERFRSGLGILWQESCRLRALQWLTRDQGFAGLKKDGKEFPLEIGINPMKAAGGDCLMVASFRDVGAQVQAERARIEAERRFRAVIDQTFGAIGLLSTDGIVLETNKTSLEFSGLSREEVVGRPLWETRWWNWDPAAQAQLRNAIDRATSGQLVRFETKHPGADGTLRDIDFSLSPVFDEGGRVCLLIPEGRDITCLLRARQQIQQQQASLALTEEMGRLKDQFLSVVSHEMRTPLSVIIGNAEILQDQHPDTPLIDEILVGAHRLSRQIDNILEYSSLLAGNLRLFPTDVSLPEVLDVVRDAVAADFAASGVDFVIDLPGEMPCLVADAYRLTQMLHLLLDNGRRFSPEGGKVGIRVRREAGEVVLVVWDTGPGIPDDLLERVFEPFFQGDVDESSRRGGLGLGLTIARKLAELHGGRITCARNQPGGHQCSIALPLGSRAQVQALS